MDVVEVRPVLPVTESYQRTEFVENAFQMTAGAVSGVAGLVVGHPLDTIKTLSQNSGTDFHMRQTLSEVRKAGLSTFFRGLSVPFWSYAGVNAILFMSYKYAYRALDPEQESARASVLAGAFAGVVQLIPGTPVEVIKIQMQKDAIKLGEHKHLQRQGLGIYLKNIYQQSGIRGLYAGLGAHASRDIPAFIIYFYSYKYLTDRMRERTSFNNLTNSFIAGALAGVLSWTLLIPQDVIKTRIQAGSEKTAGSCFRALKEMGYKSFFKGGLMMTTRAFITNAVIFCVYEDCYSRLDKLDKGRH